ncbi:MAG TPA: dienelactone hydrolase family protein [Actinomycetota bacterium]|nr:dienelactone hydrolase family protein [Actinomycetota bacterium]
MTPPPDPAEHRTPDGLIVLPRDAGPTATVAVLHPWWGLTEFIADRCRELARAGYLAVAPDLYRGEVASTPEEAQRLRKKRYPGSTWRRIVATVQSARTEHSPDTPVGLIGYSMGGHWALWLASQARAEVPTISATVVYYATRACDFAASQAAFQFHFAESDPFVSASGIAAQERALRAAGRPYEIHRYPGTGHWFAEHDRPEAYQPDAAALSWDRTLAFLGQRLAD